ncbi:hypothetical protein SAMN05421664_2907 [Chryseobacterium soldanellicola]|uniref:Uncharacterized protein n=1 Tax=Chryseobacterium soldanellicola TaxID=311333 RepID=A0A1H1F7J8_9FLAO|nr:hypothetical protein [Chryseobacterium soldanellicola]SDQ96952.1 hypothetical protein SAMN05421664_2907 [Chryseobacterium soldanellicola]
MDIISKFTVASEQGIDLLCELKELQLREMYKGQIEPEKLNELIESELNRRAAINELNDLSAQMVSFCDTSHAHWKSVGNRNIDY